MNSLDNEAFLDPPAHHWPGYFWTLNDRVDEAVLIKQLRDMAAHGAKSVCLLPEPPEFRPSTFVSRLDLPYLSPTYFTLIERLVEECERLGMNYYLYDEGGWPSGGACGLVLRADPEHFARRYLAASEKGPAVTTEADDPATRAPYPNLLAPGVAETFIELTHERHRHRVGTHFGKTIRFAFTDEPKGPTAAAGRLPWTDDLPTIFRQRKGYALEPFLPELLEEEGNDEPTERTAARVDLFDVLSQLFVERYLLPLRTWCRANKLLSGGHLDGEDAPENCARYGHLHVLRALRAMDLPGIDVIWRQLFPGRANRPFPKYASSVARQAGRPYVLAEAFAVYGNGLQPGQMKWLIDYLLVRGANTMVFSSISQSHRGNFMSGCRPHFGPVDPLWQYSEQLHTYVARASCLLTRGRPVCDTAVYFDIRSIWAGGSAKDRAVATHLAVSEHLLQRQCDFDYVDDDALEAARVRDGTLVVGDMRYGTIIVPPTQWMTPGAMARLADFEAAGGRVVSPGDLDSVRPLIALTPDQPCIRVCKRLVGSSPLYFLTNESEHDVEVRIRLPETDGVVLADPETGTFLSVRPEAADETGTEIAWSFPPCGSAFFLVGATSQGTLTRPTVCAREPLDTGWSLRPLKRHFPGPEDYEIETMDVPATPAALGDWRPYLGDDFSGDAVYEVDVASPFADGQVQLNLGTVNYACSVRLNGRELGRRLFGPFVFPLPGLRRRGRNRLEITVTNTLANALAPDIVLEHFRSNCPPVSPYEDRQRAFEAESLVSGLIGPVMLERCAPR